MGHVLVSHDSDMTLSVQHEVDLSRKECPFVIKPKIQRPSTAAETEDMDTDMDSQFPFSFISNLYYLEFQMYYLSDVTVIVVQSANMIYKFGC